MMWKFDLFLIRFLCFLIVAICSEIPKVKRLGASEYSKDVKGTEAPEPINHIHPNPLLALNPKSIKPKYEQQKEEEYVHGEAEKFSLPNKYDTLAPIRRVEDTEVICLKNHMIVNFKFSYPFNGYIYPYEHFMKCILYTGQNSESASLKLHHGECGDDKIENAVHPEFSAIIEHRLMIQWEKDFVCIDDSSIIVRCDRPDDFNKTIAWDFGTLDLASTLERNTHPGPKMFMDIKRGEGPNAPPLNDKPVFLGDTLTLVFKLSDDVFWFGSNILSCTAVDGGDHEGLDGSGRYSVNPYVGRMTVIEDECSTKLKLFSHFHKERKTTDGHLVALHYASFKAFRFPTSSKVIIQCDVQVCYKKCEPLPPCNVGFQPRSAQSRRKRSLSINDTRKIEEGTELDTVLLYRTLEIFSAEEGALKGIPVKTFVNKPGNVVQELKGDCYSSFIFFGWISLFVLSTLLLSLALIWNCKESSNGKS